MVTTHQLHPDSLGLLRTKDVEIIFKELGTDNVRFIGGCVRDAILGNANQDIDLATSYTPDEVTDKLTAHNIKVVPTGIKHGTVTAVINHHPIEITTLRNDIECFGRSAEVSFTKDWKEDALRRDFTMNSLSCDWDGNVYDYTNGYQDLLDKHVKFVGNAHDRCQEDYLRILRYFRFLARYGVVENINNDALEASRLYAHHLDKLSGERIQAEMFKLLTSANPTLSLTLMQHEEVLSHVLPHNVSFEALDKCIHSGLDNLHPIICLACLLRTNIAYDKQAIDALANHWKLSNAHRALLHFYTSYPNLEDISTRAKHLIRTEGKEKFIGIALIAYSFYPNKVALQSLIDLSHSWEVPVFPLRGEHMQQLGFEGKEIGHWLRFAESWWEEHEYPTNIEQIIEAVKKEKRK